MLSFIPKFIPKIKQPILMREKLKKDLICFELYLSNPNIWKTKAFVNFKSHTHINKGLKYFTTPIQAGLYIKKMKALFS